MFSPKTYFITYGNEKFKQSKKRIVSEAKIFGKFDYINSYGPEHLDANFTKKFKHILDQPRIGGYGIWRPYIIKKELEKLSKGDYLIYLDSGCSINIKGLKRYKEYLEMLDNSDKGIISFQMTHKEKQFTTKEIFNHFDIDMKSDISMSGQMLDGILIMKKNKNLIKIIDIWYDTIYKNVLLFTDYYNKQNQIPDFIDNRHEQSILSIIMKKYGSIILKDETYFKQFGNDRSLLYPFWATRLRM